MPDDSRPDAPASSTDKINTESHSNAEIRQLKRSQRRLLSSRTQLQHSQSLSQITTKEKAWRCSQHIALYLANDSEIDPYLLIEHARFMGKNIYLPILAPLKNSLYFSPYEAGDRLKLNRFKILEPVCHPSKWKPPVNWTYCYYHWLPLIPTVTAWVWAVAFMIAHWLICNIDVSGKSQHWSDWHMKYKR